MDAVELIQIMSYQAKQIQENQWQLKIILDLAGLPQKILCAQPTLEADRVASPA